MDETTLPPPNLLSKRHLSRRTRLSGCTRETSINRDPTIKLHSHCGAGRQEEGALCVVLRWFLWQIQFILGAKQQ